MEMQLEWWWWCTRKSTWNPATWLCRWKWDSSGLVFGSYRDDHPLIWGKSMEIISTEFRFPQEVFRISNPENRKPQAFKNPSQQDAPKQTGCPHAPNGEMPAASGTRRRVSCFSCKLLKRHVNNLESGMPVFVGLWTSVAAIQWNSFKNL